MKKIVFDVDGVVLQFTKGLSDFLWKTQRRYICLDPHTWDFNGRASFQDLTDFWHSPDFERIPPYDDVLIYMLNELPDNYEIAFLTDTPDYAMHERELNLRRLGLNYPIYYSSDKIKFIKDNNWDVVLMIDDKPETALQFVDKTNIPIASPVRAYNVNQLQATDVLLYGNINELHEIIKKYI